MIKLLVEVTCFFLQRYPEMSEKRNFMGSLSNWEVSFFQQGGLQLVWGGCRGRPLVPASVHKVVFDSLLICFSWAARPISVLDGLRLLIVNCMEERGEDPPGLCQFITPDKVHLGADKDVKDETLVRFRKTGIPVSGLVGQIQFCFLQAE